MKRKFLFLSLVMALVLAVTACGTPATTATTAAPGESTTAATTTLGPPTELNYTYLTFGPVPADVQLVEDEVNKITIPAINVKVKLQILNFGAAFEQYNLMLTGGEKIDLMISLPRDYEGMVAKNQLLPIDDLLNQYGQDIKSVVGENFIKGSMINGKTYGVTGMRDLAGGSGLCIRKDIVDKYKIDLSKVKSFNDLEAVFKVIKDNEPDMTPLIPSSASATILEMYVDYDMLGDNLGVLQNFGDNLKVVDWFQTAEYKDLVTTMRDWYNKGYILKDAATNKEDQFSLLKANKGYAYIVPTKPGMALQESSSAGMPMVVQEFAKPLSSSSNVTVFQWVIPTNCKSPDKAMQLLNLTYSNADLVNLLAWGIEGKHYIVKADGTIGNPPTVTADSPSGYALHTPWMFGNSFIAHVWEGNPADLGKQTDAFNKAATVSKAMGFSYDGTSVKNEIAAVSSVIAQYRIALECGSVDPVTVLPEFIAKLKDAGIDKIVAEKQKQLDAWAVANGVK